MTCFWSNEQSIFRCSFKMISSVIAYFNSWIRSGKTKDYISYLRLISFTRTSFIRQISTHFSTGPFLRFLHRIFAQTHTAFRVPSNSAWTWTRQKHTLFSTAALSSSSSTTWTRRKSHWAKSSPKTQAYTTGSWIKCYNIYNF